MPQSPSDRWVADEKKWDEEEEDGVVLTGRGRTVRGKDTKGKALSD